MPISRNQSGDTPEVYRTCLAGGPGKEIVEPPIEPSILHGTAQLLRDHLIPVPPDSLPEKDLFPVTQQSRVQPEFNTEILKPGPLVKKSLLLRYEVQPPAPAVEASTALPEGGYAIGKQEILFSNPIVTHLVLRRKPIEMDQ
jgi:hypothetical protein